jgi:hypothetical protein
MSITDWIEEQEKDEQETLTRLQELFKEVVNGDFLPFETDVSEHLDMALANVAIEDAERMQMIWVYKCLRRLFLGKPVKDKHLRWLVAMREYEEPWSTPEERNRTKYQDAIDLFRDQMQDSRDAHCELEKIERRQREQKYGR